MCIRDSFDAVQNEDAQFGVLPFENSNAGDVSTVLDLLYTHPDIIIARMCDLPIRQELLGVPGATLETVRTVISHPQDVYKRQALYSLLEKGTFWNQLVRMS